MLKNEDITTKQHLVWRTKIRFQNPALAIAMAVRCKPKDIPPYKDRILRMIKSINIKNVATYDNQGVQLNDLKKINFIYGANGCGKTTISNLIHDCLDPKFSNCTITWQNELPLKILVYNKEFKERNFGKGKLNGVFTLGEATGEQIKEIESKNDKLKAIKAEGQQKRETLEKQKKTKEDLENSFKETTWIKSI